MRCIYFSLLIPVAVVAIIEMARADYLEDDAEPEGKKYILNQFPIFGKIAGPKNKETSYATTNTFKNTATVGEEQFFLMKGQYLRPIRGGHRMSPIRKIHSRKLLDICQKFMAHPLFVNMNVKIPPRYVMDEHSTRKTVVAKYYDAKPRDHKMYKCPCFVDSAPSEDKRDYPRFGERICKGNAFYLAAGLKRRYDSAFVFTYDTEGNQDVVRVVAHIVHY